MMSYLLLLLGLVLVVGALVVGVGYALFLAFTALTFGKALVVTFLVGVVLMILALLFSPDL